MLLKRLLPLILLLAGVANAQTTSVTATVTDPSSGAYARGTWSATFVPPTGNNNPPLLNGSTFTKFFSGTTDATGALAVTVADNNVVTPAGSTWLFQVCSFGSICFQYQLVITGASQSISVALSTHSAPLLGSTKVSNNFPSSASGIVVVQAQGQTAQPFIIYDAQGNVVSAGGGGTVTSVALTMPNWLVVAGSPIITSGTLAVSAATGQTSGLVIGTCGSNTSFAPCALTATDLPSTGITPGSYTNVNLTVLANGTISAIANGGAGNASITVNGGSALSYPINFPNASASLGVTINAVQSTSNISFQLAAGSILNATGGGTGLTNPLAHSLLQAEGSSAMTLCTSPSINGTYNVVFVVTAATSVDCSIVLPGVPVVAETGATDTLAYSGRGSFFDISGGTTFGFTLPAASGNLASNLPLVIYNGNSGNTTVTPTTPNNINGGTSQAPLTILPKFADFIYQDALATIGWWDLGGGLLTYNAMGANCGDATHATKWSTTTGIGCQSFPVFVASGASHALGQVPDPGASAGTTHFLREDATWAVPAGGSNGFPASGTANAVIIDSGSTSGLDSTVTIPSGVITIPAAGGVDASAVTAAGNFKVPSIAGASPGTTISIAWDSTQQRWVVGGTNLGTAALDRTFFSDNCTTDSNCSTQAATSPGTGNGNQDTASGTSGTSTLYFKGVSIPANTIITNKIIRACAVFNLTTSSSAPTSLVALNLGTTTIVSIAAATSNSQTNTGIAFCATIQGTAASGASVSVVGGWDTTTSYQNTVFQKTAQPVAGIATNGALIISWSNVWSAATAANTLTLESQYVQVLD